MPTSGTTYRVKQSVRLYTFIDLVLSADHFCFISVLFAKGGRIPSFGFNYFIKNQKLIFLTSFPVRKVKKSQTPKSLAYAIDMLCRLDDVGSLWATCSLDDLELYILTFVERLETFILNCREVDEYIVSAFTRDEAIAFLRAEPFYFANHNDSS